MKPHKLLYVVLVIVGAFSFAVTPRAATVAEFTQNAFAAAQHQGKPIIVHITASWCPTCAAQRPILARLESQPEFRDLLVFNVDFDTQKDVVREMHARMQSTIVAFRGEKEVGRSVGDTKPDSLRALLDQAVR
jgi:thiol-disulfide isomerase/thioredoxin